MKLGRNTALLVLTLALPLEVLAQDPFLWLEDIDSPQAMRWVEERNEATLGVLQAHHTYDELFTRTLSILNSPERIAFPSFAGAHLYNFWQDEKNPRGLLRRTDEPSYLRGQPVWETVLDIDALAATEQVNWAYGGVRCMPPEYRRCLISLSRGGADARQVREFDAERREFVAGGFFLPEAKGAADWIDENTLIVATDFGEGSLTTSGYPRIVKLWRRGTTLQQARTIFEGAATDVGVWGYSAYVQGRLIPLVSHAPSFFESTTHVLRNGSLTALDLPKDGSIGLVDDRLVVYLRSSWTVSGRSYPQDALIGIGLDDFLRGERRFVVIHAGGDRQSIRGYSTTANHVLVNVLNNVRSELHRYRYRDGRWVGERIPAPDFGSIGISSTSSLTDRFFFTYSSYLQPTSLFFGDADGSVTLVRQLPAMFDAASHEVTQFETRSRDGTPIPYFVVMPKGMAMDGTNPTLLYGYGGFESPLTPGYSAIVGASWLERGGVYVAANIRGGGEFGPAWHRAAQKEHKQRSYDDFIAVAEDLIARGITSPPHLGIMGGSNGGLLVGAVLTQRPELFGAVVCQVPLLDMQRYHRLLAGASWMAEYGDPDDPSEWEYISRYSPYHNIRPDQRYPRVLFTTTTRDDRVHPGHARKMVAKMESMGYPVYYFENTEGGHGSGTTPEQRATMSAVTYAYLWEQLRTVVP